MEGFGATPSPIIAPNGVGITTVSGVSSCDFDVRVGSPRTGKYNMSASTGTWVTDGMTFFMQPRGDVTSQATLATLKVPVLATQPACDVTEFSANPSLIITPSGYGDTVITAAAGCAFDVRVGAPDGQLVDASFTGYSSKDTGPAVTHGTTYYLQMRGDTSSKGTLSTVRVSVLSNAPLCNVMQFSANPNPITMTGGLGQTAINVAAACSFDVRIGSPSGPLFATGTGSLSAQTGEWVTDGMIFYLQFGGNTTAQGTLSILTVAATAAGPPSPFACTVNQFFANPNPIVTPLNLGATTITADAQCSYDVRVGAPDGPLFASGAGLTSAQTGPWVTNGLTFYLQSWGNTLPQGTLGTVTVGLQP